MNTPPRILSVIKDRPPTVQERLKLLFTTMNQKQAQERQQREDRKLAERKLWWREKED